MEKIAPNRPPVTATEVAWKTDKAAARLSIPATQAPKNSPETHATFEAAPVGKASAGPTSTLHFDVHPKMAEVVDFATRQGWFAQGWSQLSIFAQEIVYSTDDWKTTHSLRSSTVPSPFVNGRILLPNVAEGTRVNFALHVSVACSAPSDIAGHRERGQLWLNNGGWNYTQETR